MLLVRLPAISLVACLVIDQRMAEATDVSRLAYIVDLMNRAGQYYDIIIYRDISSYIVFKIVIP